MKDSSGYATTADKQEANALTTAFEKWFIDRGIEPETAINCGIYTAKGGGTLVFPFLEDGVTVNEKYRHKGKKFSQREGGKRTFWNHSGLEIAVLEDKPFLITEGEMDTLSAIQAGYPWASSVPDGAPQKRSEGFYSRDEDQKFKFLWNNESLLDKVKIFILAGDNDEPGRVLNHELQKRLGAESCKFITYPDGCKDLNDVLVKYDAQKVMEIIFKAKDYPVVGLYRPDEFPPIPEEVKQPYSTGMGWQHDQHIKIILGKFMVVTGIPGHGKSEWADSLGMNLAREHDWKICVCSTEIDNEDYEQNSIYRIICRPLAKAEDHVIEKAKQFYQDHFIFVTNNTMDVDMELTLEKLIELAEIAIIRDGCKVLLLDPWNEIEHRRNPDETETEYTSRAIRMLKKLARQYHIFVIVVAHPTKPQFGKIQCPNLYSISGSANWANKADYGIIIWRDSIDGDMSEIRIAKIKCHGPMGKPGSIQVKLNEHTRRFDEVSL